MHEGRFITSRLGVKHLSLGAEGLLEVLGEGTLLVEVLDVAAIGLETASGTLGDVVLAGELGETPLLGDNDLLATGELELGAAEGLNDHSLVRVLATDREDDLADIDTGSSAVGLTVGTTHTGLKTISTGTGQHLVDAENVEGVETDTHVEGILAGGLGDVLVGANATSLKSLGRDLLLLVAQQVDAQGELVNTGLLTTQIVDTDLGVWKKEKRKRVEENTVVRDGVLFRMCGKGLYSDRFPSCCGSGIGCSIQAHC